MSKRDWTSPQRLIDAQFAAWVRQHRNELGLTQRRLAERIPGLIQGQIDRTEHADRLVSIGESFYFAQAFGVPLADFAPDIPNVSMACSTCDGKPPRGFSCNACGEAS